MEPLTQHRSEIAVLEQGVAWADSGATVILATVAHTWGSSPRPVGSVMVLTTDGRFMGSVSGGCIEEELLQTVREGVDQAFSVIEYDSNQTRTLPCGGRLLLTLERLDTIRDLSGLLACLGGGGSAVRRLNLERGDVSWHVADTAAVTHFDGTILDVLYAPTWRLLICGAGELAQWVCRMGLLLDYAVAVCDPREDYRAAWPIEEVRVSDQYPDDFLSALSCDARTAIVALTHDPKVDDLAVLEGIQGDAFYIGALGSRRTTAARAERLKEHFGCTDDQLRKISGPIGIDLNSRKPQEIALSILVELSARRNGVDIRTERRGDG